MNEASFKLQHQTSNIAKQLAPNPSFTIEPLYRPNEHGYIKQALESKSVWSPPLLLGAGRFALLLPALRGLPALWDPLATWK